jgi:shikimate dehydrogenase
MKTAAVIGFPISHSRSPAIFEFLARELGVADLRYEANAVDPAGLPAFLARVRSEVGWLGVNVTIPHKEAMLPLVDTLSPEARVVGAVNVVQAVGGKLIGHNTDIRGVVRSLEMSGAVVRGEAAYVIGAGGAVRAVAYALGLLGAAEVFIANRTSARAVKIAVEIGPLFPATKFHVVADGAPPESVDRKYSLVVNGTPLGMRGYPADSALENFSTVLAKLACRPNAVAFDLIYDPESTPFLDAASERGLRVLGGLDMLIYQALATWEIWRGTPFAAADEKRLRDGLAVFLRARIRENAPIFLAGFMGVGKSTVGAILARNLGWGFIDTDSLVTGTAGKSIAKIFSDGGETEFRGLEASAVASACGKLRTVVALGGGALLNPASFRKIEASGTLVFLGAHPESLEARLAETAGTRPLLAGLSPDARREKIRKLLEAREPLYRRARLRIDTDGLSPEEIARQVARAVRKDTA